MNPFKYTRAQTVATVMQSMSTNSNAKLLAGGTNLVDLMKEGVENPDELIDINGLKGTKFTSVTKLVSGANAGGVAIGALATNTDTANHPLIVKDFPLLSQSILAGASAQIRNMATNGGNLLQRTRCSYFYDTAMACNKRAPGTGCGAMEGINRMHAIFGWSGACIAVNPSDMNVALAALGAKVMVQGANGQARAIPFADFHRLPGDEPSKDNTLAPGELVVSIEIPKNKFAATSYYLKVRDRASYAFALVSVATGLEITGGKISSARIAMGGVAHKPWRALEAEQYLAGKQPTSDHFNAAALLEMKRAKPLEHNAFKVELGQRAIAYALSKAMKINAT